MSSKANAGKEAGSAQRPQLPPTPRQAPQLSPEAQLVEAISLNNTDSFYQALNRSPKKQYKITTKDGEELTFLEYAMAQEKINFKIVKTLLEQGFICSAESVEKNSQKLQQASEVALEIRQDILNLMKVNPSELKGNGRMEFAGSVPPPLPSRKVTARVSSKSSSSLAVASPPMAPAALSSVAAAANSPKTDFFSVKPEHKGDTQLHTAMRQAVRERRIDALEQYLQRLSPEQIAQQIDLKNTEGDTALHIAARANFVSGIEMLLEKGADRDIKNKNNKTPLELAKDGGFYHPKGAFYVLGGVLKVEDEGPSLYVNVC